MGDQHERFKCRKKLCSELEWTCKRCEENNPFVATSCLKCQRRNVAYERLQMNLRETTTAGNWHCKTCTFINEEQFLNCEFCTSPRFDEKQSASSNGEVVIQGRNLHLKESCPDDILDGKIKGLLPTHDEDRISREEIQAYIIEAFFSFLRHGYIEQSDEDKINQEMSPKKGSRPKPGIRNTRIFQIVFEKKGSKSDQIRTTALSGDQSCQDEKKTTDYEKDKWVISKVAIPDINDREGTENVRFLKKRGVATKKEEELEETRKEKQSEKTKKEKETDETKKEEADMAKAETVILHEAKMKLPRDASIVAAKTGKTWYCEICYCINLGTLKKCAVCGHHCPIITYFSTKLIRRRMLKKAKSLEIEHLQRQEEEEARRKLKNIKAFCKKGNTLFVDGRFLPVLRSLYFEPREDSVNPKWLRFHDISCSSAEKKEVPWSVVNFEPRADDIEQGCLDNGWFLSALGVMVEKHDFFLIKILLNKKISKQGAYFVRLCKDGCWKIILIDDFFPCDENHGLLYSKTKRKQLWVPLIEKAAAKLFGCYEALNSGTCGEALTLLTGEPCEIIFIRDDDDDRVIRSERIWEKMNVARESRCLMAASTTSFTTDRNGLCPNHSYSIFGVYDIEGNQLVKMRDPRGVSSWNGRWSDKSDDWNNLSPSAKRELRQGRYIDGIFWMCLRDLLTYFDSIEICKARNDGRELRIKGCFPPHADQPWKLVNIYLEDRAVLNLNLFQKSKRGIDSANEPSVDLLIVILQKKPSGEGFTHVAGFSRRNSRNFVGCEVTLRAGFYTVACLAFKNWQTGVPTSNLFDMETIEELNKDFVLVIHTSSYILSDEFDTVSPKFHYILADIMILLAIEKGKQRILERGGFVLYMLWWYGAIIVVENRSPFLYGKIKCDCTDSCYLISTRGTFITMDCVPPKHRQVVMLLTPLFPQRGWSVLRKLFHSLDKQIGFSEEWNATPGVQHVPEIQSKIAGLHSPRPFYMDFHTEEIKHRLEKIFCYKRTSKGNLEYREKTLRHGTGRLFWIELSASGERHS